MAVIVSSMLSSCSGNWACKMCVKRGGIKADTVRVDSLIFIPVVQFDSIVHYDLSTDTLVIIKDKLTIKYKKLQGDTIYLAGECAPDTLRVTETQIITNEIKTGYSGWQLIATGVGVLLLMLAVLFVALKAK